MVFISRGGNAGPERASDFLNRLEQVIRITMKMVRADVDQAQTLQGLGPFKDLYAYEPL